MTSGVYIRQPWHKNTDPTKWINRAAWDKAAKTKIANNAWKVKQIQAENPPEDEFIEGLQNQHVPKLLELIVQLRSSRRWT